MEVSMKIKINSDKRSLFCDRCGYEIIFSDFGGSKGHICSKCGHGNILVSDPNLFTKLGIPLRDKFFKLERFAGLDKDRFYRELEEMIKQKKPYRYDVFELENHPNYKFLAELLIED